MDVDCDHDNPDRETDLELRAEQDRDRAVGELAELIHGEMCHHTPTCARRKNHAEYYRDRATALIAALEPEIGIANVFLAVRTILDELW